ncbi:MAG: TonB-dependent receptor domain-containing protein [Pyrinomonadaceae bacterium]
MRSVSRFFASGLVLMFLFAAVVFAQGTQTGALTGVVSDPQGLVVSGASVDIVSESTGKSVRAVTTGADGGFSATFLPPGKYSLEITATNFKKAIVAGVEVRINDTTRQDVALELGKIEETVNVEASPSLINPASAQTGQPIDSQTISRLPLASPNIMFLLSLSSGTGSEPVDVRSAGRGNVDINVNGQRTTNNSVTLDGINVNDFNLAHFDTIPLPNPNTIQDFKVATSLYDASSGSKGGGALGLVLKSGTKDFHGELYWSHRNDALNANEFFRNKAGLSKNARLLQNVFGGSASGPVPKLGGFWFFNYQGVRGRNGIDPNGASLNPLIQAFPTNSDGTTSAALLASAFGLTTSQIDPIAVNILNLKSDIFGGAFAIPRPGGGGCAASAPTGTFRCVFSKIIPLQANQHTITYDRYMREGKDKVSWRWFWDDGSASRPYGTAASLAFPSDSVQKNRFVSISETHVFGASMTNEIRAGYSRFISSFSPTDKIDLSQISATRPNVGSVPGIYFFSIANLFSLGTGVNDERGTISNNYNLADTFSWTFGKHSLRIGGEGTQYQLNRFNNFAIRGSLAFGATTGTGNTFTAFQNFLQGRITGIQSAFGDAARNFVATDYAGFVQDDYRFSPRLTFNLGFRWEPMSFGHDKLYRQNIYDPLVAAQGKNPFRFPEKVNLGGFKGTPGIPDCALGHCRDMNNFAPRFGFALDIKGDQKMVLRGGYGIYYQRLSNQNILQGALGPPFTVQPIDTRANPPAFQLANPLAGQGAVAGIATAFIPQWARFAGLRRISGTGPLDINDPNVGPIFVNEDGQACLNYGGTATNCVINLASFTSSPVDAYTPYTQQYNLTLQRELWKGWGVEAGYVGTHYIGGLGIWDPFLAKLASPSSPIVVRDSNGVSYSITTNTTNNEELRHQILGLSRKRGSRYSGNIGDGKYHSAQFTLLRRLQRGLYFQAAYTWSKNTDNVSGSQSTDELNATRAGQGGANILNDSSNPRQNRARGDFDRPHRFVVSYSYDVPVMKNSFMDNQFFKGWTVSGIVTYQSGLPFSITDSTSGGAFGGGTGTGVLVCRPLSEQIASLPGCTPGTPTTTQQLLLTGPIQNRLNNYLNPNFVSTAAIVPNGAAGATGYGNVPRNAFRAPFQQNWDLSVMKRFTLMERHQFHFRTDIFNLWNHPVFQTPSSVGVASPSTFGVITSTAIPARLIQFNLGYKF